MESHRSRSRQQSSKNFHLEGNVVVINEANSQPVKRAHSARATPSSASSSKQPETKALSNLQFCYGQPHTGEGRSQRSKKECVAGENVMSAPNSQRDCSTKHHKQKRELLENNLKSINNFYSIQVDDSLEDL